MICFLRLRHARRAAATYEMLLRLAMAMLILDINPSKQAAVSRAVSYKK